MIGGDRNPHAQALRGSCVLRRRRPSVHAVTPAILARQYELLSLADIDVGYPGRCSANHPVHGALAKLEPGMTLSARLHDQTVSLVDLSGCCVARLSKAAGSRWRDRLARVIDARVVAMVRRQRKDEQGDYAAQCRCERWEVPLVELVSDG